MVASASETRSNSDSFSKTSSVDNSKNSAIFSVPAPVSDEKSSSKSFSFNTSSFDTQTSMKEEPKSASSFSFSSNAFDSKKDAEPIKSNSIFSFPSTTAEKKTEPAAAISFAPSGAFAFPAPAVAAAGSGGGLFGFPSAGPGFSFSAAPGQSAVRAEADDDGAGGGEDGEEDAAPMLEPEKVLRNESDTDEVVHEVEKCKIFRFKKENNEWVEFGKGLFRITMDKDTKARRMLVRNLTGKVMLNAAFFRGMTFTKIGKNGIRFMAVVDDSGEPKMIMIKLKEEEFAPTMKALTNSAAMI